MLFCGGINITYKSPIGNCVILLIKDLTHPLSLKNDLCMLCAISCDLPSPPGPVTEF